MSARRECRTCTFYAALKQECRRNPPTVFVVITPKGPAPVSAFPQLPPEGWCGEHVVDLGLAVNH